ncbi:DUF4762 family protein [Klebsiella indica]|uniref:DUF4762 domain-containing protein n=1 Tax=Klebsiella indica TaxID=2582917 RepID=A0A5R9LMM2_9ENTR|nr:MULTISPECIES: DUF4762 family protein [Klebsiella]TLV21969.1 DUF4762 domain-containing protein [Klebsiella indica]
MQKLSMIEASAIIGGCKEVCTTSYESVIIGGVSSCKEVTTCTDKYGNSTVSMKDAANNMCFVPNRIRQ